MDENQNKILLLAETQKAFTDWPMNNKKGTFIPVELWDKALALLSFFRVGKLVTILRLVRPSASS